jgi:hypothetical protein
MTMSENFFSSLTEEQNKLEWLSQASFLRLVYNSLLDLSTLRHPSLRVGSKQVVDEINKLAQDKQSGLLIVTEKKVL